MEDAIDILLVEDSETDAELTIESLRDGKLSNRVSHVWDGEEAIRFLCREGDYTDAPRPDLILLDLNLPRLDGHEVLKFMRADPGLSVIPVVILTTSNQEKDILKSYGLAANNYIVKPVDLEQFFAVVQQIQDFWLKVVRLPPKS